MAKRKERGGAMSNFKTALRELVNGEAPAEEEIVQPEVEPERQPEREELVKEEPVIEAPQYDEPTLEDLRTLQDEQKEEEYNEQDFEEEEEMAFEQNGAYPQGYGGENMRNRTIIAEDVEIIGDIRARGDIDVYGAIEGNVFSEGHVTVAGAISGSVVAASADFESGTLSGDAIQIQSHIEIKQGVEIVGEIQAASMEVNGTVQGNIAVADQVVLNASANITGDITAQYISIQKGAVLNGKLSINQALPEYDEPMAEAPVQEAAPEAPVQQQAPEAPAQPAPEAPAEQ